MKQPLTRQSASKVEPFKPIDLTVTGTSNFNIQNVEKPLLKLNTLGNQQKPKISDQQFMKQVSFQCLESVSAETTDDRKSKIEQFINKKTLFN